MSLAVFEKVSLFFADRPIVDELDLRVAEGDRIGLIGPNGSGKSTLLKMLAGEQVPDSGKIILRKGSRLGYLPQDLSIEGGRSLVEFVLASVPGRNELDAQLVETEQEFARIEQAGDTDLLNDVVERLSDLHERIGHFEEHFSEHEALSILSGLGFKDEDRKRDLAEFSGGWKMRAVLAALLFQRPDLLLLDEPTNHLDMQTVTWFANFLQRYPRAFFLISHDREFLNEQIARVVSFEVEGVRQYPGDYERYLKQRAEEEQLLSNRARNVEREREQAQRLIDRFRAQANKAKMVQSRIKQLEKMETVETLEKAAVMRFSFPPTERCSNDVLVAEGLNKSFGARRVLSDVNLRVAKGQRIAIIGPNGAGKTTLLKMLASELTPDTGSVALGHHVKVGYFAQHHADKLHADSTPYQEVAEVDPASGMTRVRTVLGAFLFRGDDVDKKIRVLSGGERARVALARLLIKPGNFLMMDEPTNHLDLGSSESLAESLASYDGTLLFVSHNRSFVKHLATQIWNLEDGKVEVYPGTLDEFMFALKQRQEAAKQGEKEPGTGRGRGTGTQTQTQTQTPKSVSLPGESDKDRKRREADVRQQRSKVIKPLKDKVAKLEAQIEKVETAQKERTAKLADPAVYADAKKSNQLLVEFSEGKGELAKLTEEWEALSEQLEKKEAELG
ncbi:MAG TPA: ABC-F family ATP-binding cassette domain-containing protein [Polyangiales bacterium]|nr:ABC-F family ATP-binding cassette domain-containing protein [Polyangiales bacterium]